MKEKTNRFLSEIILGEDEGAPEEIQLMRTGSFNHLWYGDFKITKENFIEMAENFKKKVRKIDLAIDIAHNSQSDAAGWIKKLFTKEDDKQLWAKVQWTALGKEKIEGKLFRYLSAEYDPEYMDSESGKGHGFVLLGAGLTNRPFIKKMKATSKLSEEQQMEEKLKELEAKNKLLGEKVSGVEGSVKSLQEENKKLSEENEKLNKDIKLAEKEKAFDALLSEGKLVPAQKEAYLAGDCEKLAENAGKVNLDEQGHGHNQEEKKTDDDLIAAANKLALDEKITQSEATLQLLNEPEYSHLGG